MTRLAGGAVAVLLLVAIAGRPAPAETVHGAQADLLARDAPHASREALEGTVTAPAGGPRYLGAFRVTYYWVASEDDRFRDLPASATLRDAAGGVLGRVSAAFRRELDREGTGRLRDGRVLNVHRKVDGEWRYVDLGAGAWGMGSTGAALTPFASVAVDPDRVPLGSRLFVPAFEGQPLPDGGCHPGRFRAEDRGSAIREARLDVFIGEVRHLASWEAALPSHAPADVFALPGDDALDACAE